MVQMQITHRGVVERINNSAQGVPVVMMALGEMIKHDDTLILDEIPDWVFVPFLRRKATRIEPEHVFVIGQSGMPLYLH